MYNAYFRVCYVCYDLESLFSHAIYVHEDEFKFHL